MVKPKCAVDDSSDDATGAAASVVSEDGKTGLGSRTMHWTKDELWRIDRSHGTSFHITNYESMSTTDKRELALKLSHDRSGYLQSMVTHELQFLTETKPK